MKGTKHFFIGVVYTIQIDFQNFRKINKEFLKTKNTIIMLKKETRKKNGPLFLLGWFVRFKLTFKILEKSIKNFERQKNNYNYCKRDTWKG